MAIWPFWPTREKKKRKKEKRNRERRSAVCDPSQAARVVLDPGQAAPASSAVHGDLG